MKYAATSAKTIASTQLMALRFFLFFMFFRDRIALHFLVSASGFGFFRLFFGFQTHFVGFSACFSLATHIRQRNRHAPIRLLAKKQFSMLCLPA